MGFGLDANDNVMTWKFRIGALFRISIYIHLFFIAGAVIIISMAIGKAPEGYVAPTLLQTLGIIGMLFVIVLVHEFGHCFGARYSGGEADEILLWPLGGLATVRPPHTPKAHFITVAAGPMVNVIFCTFTAVLLIVRSGSAAIPWNPLSTMSTALGHDDVVTRWTAVFFALNYVVLLFNLLPIYPMDGGRMLHAYLWPRQGYRNATMTAAYIGIIGGVILGLVGLLVHEFLILGIAVFGIMTCYMDRRAIRMNMMEETSEFGYDFSRGYAAFEDEPLPEKKPGFFQRRRIAREVARSEREAVEARNHREQVDRILEKVHRSGMSSLTAEEHRILEKETERQRSVED